MAKVKEIPLGRPHQVAVCRTARKELRRRPGGIVLADGVGLGKTYEALGTIASYLAQQQHGRIRMQRKFKVLCLVPPGLVTKWADELLLPDRFTVYLKSWRSPAHQGIAATFSDVVVIRRKSDLESRPGKVRYGQHELPGGFYIVNSNLLYKDGRKVTQVHRTGWDAIIVDEAHHLGAGLLDLPPHTLFGAKKTAVLLLTATPFQLSPQDMKGLLAMTFGGYGAPHNRWRAPDEANTLYNQPAFRDYRRALSTCFENGSPEAARKAAKLRVDVARLLRPRLIRNRKLENRSYHLVDQSGRPSQLPGNPFHFDRATIDQVLSAGGIIDLEPKEAQAYLHARDGLMEASARNKRTFVAGALRQLLSTWDQFRNSKSGRLAGVALPTSPHPKTKATVALVADLLAQELRAASKTKCVGKILIFTTYVGSERAEGLPSDERAHGTSAALKRALTERLALDHPRASRRVRQEISRRLLADLEAKGVNLLPEERAILRRILQRFAGSAPAHMLLRDAKQLRDEARALGQHLKNVPSAADPATDAPEKDHEQARRVAERRESLVRQIKDRYATRDLVARYDGATPQDDRDRHLRGFNSPFAPLVLIASSVGQEGIDLQCYCRHVIHYDLEWNPAKLEQREGRVDRHGRLSKGPVNVYFLLCRGTYDERIMHAMVNRFRWHHVLLANRRKLETAPGGQPEAYAEPKWFKQVALDLRPQSR